MYIILALIIIIIVAFALRSRKKAADDSLPELKKEVKCHACGYDNPPVARYCGNCGATL